MDPAQIGGIEVYPRPATTPIEYQRNVMCGTVLVWTRDPEPGGEWSWRKIAAGVTGFVVLGILVATR